jgi:hypothetical protein
MPIPFVLPATATSLPGQYRPSDGSIAPSSFWIAITWLQMALEPKKSQSHRH